MTFHTFVNIFKGLLGNGMYEEISKLCRYTEARIATSQTTAVMFYTVTNCLAMQ